MNKLAEINFTVTGTGGVPIDEVSGTTLSGSVGGSSPTVISPLPAMSNRPGFRFYVDNVVDYFQYDGGVGEVLKFSSLYLPSQRRSFVLWYYSHGSATHDAGATNYIWGGDSNGFAIHNDGLRFVRNSMATYTDSSGNNKGWHSAVTVIDRINGTYECYFDGALVYNDTTMPNLTYSGSTYGMRFGHPATDREADVSLGYVATYDTALDSGTVNSIYNDFIRDSAAGNEPLAVLSGIILDLEDVPASGAPFYLIKTSDGEIYHQGNTSNNGEFLLDIPFSGHYIAVTSALPPASGARAISLVATSGGNITYYDGS